MHQPRPQSSQDPPHPPVSAKVLTAALADLVDLNITAADPIAKIRCHCHADDCVPVRIVREVVDEIDEAILKPTDGQPIDDVTDEWSL